MLHYSTCVFYLAVDIFLAAGSDKRELGTANAAAEAEGNDNATDFNQKEKECYYTNHNSSSAVAGQK